MTQQKRMVTAHGIFRKCFSLSAVMVIMGFMLLSCSSKPQKRTYIYKDKQEAMADFRNFLNEVSSMSSYRKEDLAEILLQWNEMRGIVFAHIVGDTTNIVHDYTKQVFFQVDDSIRKRICEIVDESKPTLTDVIYVKEHASPLTNDKDITSSRDSANNFFMALDSIGLVKTSRQQVIQGYKRFLQRASVTGFQDKKDLLTFLRNEDLYFRMFLKHLAEYQGESVADITKYTEKVCKIIMASPGLDSKTKVIYMGMRTNRRLILNMQSCIDDIKHLKCRNEELANAYFFMIVQPYISLDDLSVALLTPMQSNILYENAKNMKQTIGRIKVSRNVTDLFEDQLPKQLLKTYISTITNN